MFILLFVLTLAPSGLAQTGLSTTFSTGWGINNAGDISGASETSDRSGFQAVLFRRGVMKDLGTFGDFGSVGRAINERGDVVGDSDTAVADGNGEFIFHAFLYDGAMVHDLGTLP